MEIKTYPEMNEKIKGLLRFNNEPIMLYAAARIEELEHERDAAVKDIPHKCWKCAHADELPTCSYAHYKSSHPDCLGWEWRGTKSKEG